MRRGSRIFHSIRGSPGRGGARHIGAMLRLLPLRFLRSSFRYSSESGAQLPCLASNLTHLELFGGSGRWYVGAVGRSGRSGSALRWTPVGRSLRSGCLERADGRGLRFAGPRSDVLYVRDVWSVRAIGVGASLDPGRTFLSRSGYLSVRVVGRRFAGPSGRGALYRRPTRSARGCPAALSRTVTPPCWTRPPPLFGRRRRPRRSLDRAGPEIVPVR